MVESFLVVNAAAKNLIESSYISNFAIDCLFASVVAKATNDEQKSEQTCSGCRATGRYWLMLIEWQL